MKSTTATLVFCFGLSLANAQHLKETDVPKKIKDSFAVQFPASKVSVWEKEGENYEAEFKLNKASSSAIFDANGTYKELEQEIEISALPKAVTDYCSKNHKDCKLAEAAKITDVNHKVTYEAELKKGKEAFDLIFDDKGNFIKKN